MDIARQGPCTKKCARLWVGRFEEAKEQELSDEEVVLSQPRTGRPPTVTPGVKKLILEYCKGKRKRSLRKCSKWLRGKGIKVRKDTVRKHLVQSGLYPYRRQKQPFLSAKQKKKRVKFARKYLDHDWNNTLMTDESDLICLLLPTGRTMWSGPGPWPTSHPWKSSSTPRESRSGRASRPLVERIYTSTRAQ